MGCGRMWITQSHSGVVIIINDQIQDRNNTYRAKSEAARPRVCTGNSHTSPQRQKVEMENAL